MFKPLNNLCISILVRLCSKSSKLDFSSVQFSHSVLSKSLQPHEPQHARPPCPSPNPGVWTKSCPSSWWCHPNISSCHLLFLLPSIFPSIRFPVSQYFSSGSQSIGASASTSVLPMNKITVRTDWLNLFAVQGTLKSLLQHHSSKASILQGSAFFMVQISPSYMTTRKTIALNIWTFAGKVMSLLFNMLSRFAIAFLPRSKRFF